MNTQEIIKELEYNTGTFPLTAVQEAIMHQEVITPELLQVLQQADENINFIVDHADYMAHIYAMFLLAQFREKRALPLVIKLFSHPGDISDRIADDFICEDLPRVLASLYDGDITPITHLIENPTVDEYVRSSGLHALVILVANDMKSRGEIVEYFATLYRDKLQRTPSMLWDSLVYCSCMLHPKEVYEDIKKVYEQQLTPHFFVSFSELDEYMGMNWGMLKYDLIQDNHNHLIDDTIRCMHWWACFQPERSSSIHAGKPSDRFPFEQRKKTKIGRNQPCPCGSGKKYKKCCGAVGKPSSESL